MEVEDGIRTIQLTNIADFFRFTLVAGRPSHGGLNLLWRGQARSDWQVESSMARTGKSAISHLSIFQQALARVAQIEFDLENSNSKLDENKLHLWSLGQHHGLKTPLIDWTIYPFVALFFAFESADEQTDFRSVYCLDWSIVQVLNYHITETNGIVPFRTQLNNPPYSKEFIEYLARCYFAGQTDTVIERSPFSKSERERLIAWESANLKKQRLNYHRSRAAENKRIRAQGGLHIYTPKDVPVETWIRHNRGKEKMVMTKILIPNSERQQILNSLNQMNINHLSLFPDIEGAARYSNLCLIESDRSGLLDY